MAYNSTRQLILCQNVYVADTFLKRLLGVAEGGFGNSYDGLLIRPCRSIHTFFLEYPLDVIFLDQSNRICKIYFHLKPFRITSLISSAQMVLELVGGTLLPSVAQEGDTVVFR